ncbi:TPR repeat-containing thioredoxin TDX [Capsicum baccatum]|uniref:TPR repeat-containing thioredoxin TDX n=1 Tax=Capsicum baccatum TaxID=33114 RepID=A0A2G2UZW2_CAPBA|nr:TPR repeat-containing thioredoxin TDX [Capsicum baccatum]
MGEMAPAGHFRAKSVCYSPRFSGWAQDPGVLRAKNRLDHAREKSRVVDESDDEMSDVEDKEDEKGAFEEEEKPEIIESDIELDESDIVDPDNDEPQQMRDPSVEVTEESRDASQAAKSQAMEAISEVDCKLEEASELLTKAVLLNPISAIICVLTATVCIKMKKPNAAIQDANAALEINPDLAKGYKSRGVARAMLGLWGDAARDLHIASKLDFDEEISAVLKKVEPNARKIEEHHKKYDRLRKEREDRKVERERQWRKAEAQASYDEAKKKEEESSRRAGGMPDSFPCGMPGGFPGTRCLGELLEAWLGEALLGQCPRVVLPGHAGGMPGNIDYSKILNDPDLMAPFQDPEVMAARQDVMKNPANLAKHQANPKVAPIIAKMLSKFAGPKQDSLFPSDTRIITDITLESGVGPETWWMQMKCKEAPKWTPKPSIHSTLRAPNLKPFIKGPFWSFHLTFVISL